MKSCVAAVVTIIFFAVAGNQVPIECPSRCKCDKFEKLKRVQCVDLNLVNIMDVPTSVQVLDLSNNQIKELKDHEFIDMGLISLKLLNLSHNKISDIKMHAFQNLNNIKTVDLSHNVIQYVHSEWFYDLGTLTELYLNNNDFATLPNDLIESKSLEILDLSYCRISHIKEDTFSKLPNLQHLNLEGNSLIELNINTINYLQNLQIIKLAGNPLHCENGVVKQLILYLTNNEVGFQNPCLKPKMSTNNKLERMVQLDDPVDDKNSWIYDDNNEESSNATIVYNCTNNKVDKNDLLMEIIKLSPILSLVIPFIIGLVLGLIIACSTQVQPTKIKPRPERTKRYSIIRSRMQLTEQDFPLVTNCEHLYESTPVPQRRFDFHQL